MTRVIWVVKHLDGCADSWCWTAALARCEFDTLLTHSDEAHHRAVRRRGAVLVVVRRRRKTNDHAVGVCGPCRKPLLVPEVVATADNQPGTQKQADDLAPVGFQEAPQRSHAVPPDGRWDRSCQRQHTSTPPVGGRQDYRRRFVRRGSRRSRIRLFPGRGVGLDQGVPTLGSVVISPGEAAIPLLRPVSFLIRFTYAGRRV